MVSSLAAQLSQTASLNTAFISEATRRKASESYLFSAKEAREHDFDSLHALGLNGFLQLTSISPHLRSFEQSLFSGAAKVTDRTLQTADANAELNSVITSFLPLLGPFLLDAPTGKVLEWLVRRFRINEFNVQDVLKLFLPYHDSPHFAKMVTILHIPDHSAFRFLNAYKAAAQPLPHAALVKEMSQNTDFARFVTDILPTVLRQNPGGMHRVLITLHTGVALNFIARSKHLDEGTVAYLLPASLESLHQHSGVKNDIKPATLKEAILGSFLILAALSQKCHLSSTTLRQLLSEVSLCADIVSTKQFVCTIISLCAPQDEEGELPRSLIKAVLTIPDFGNAIEDGFAWVGVEKFVRPLIKGLLSQITDEAPFALVNTILSSARLPVSVAQHAAELLLRSLIDKTYPHDFRTQASKLLSDLQQRHPKTVQLVCEETAQEDKESVKEVVVSLAMSTSDVNATGASLEYDVVVASMNADPSVRSTATGELFKRLTAEYTPMDEMKAVKEALRMRVQDTDQAVLETLYNTPDAILPVLLEDAEGYISNLVTVLHNVDSPPSKSVIRSHLAFLANSFFSALSPPLSERVFQEIFFPFLLFSKPKQKTVNVVWDLLEKKDDSNDEPGIEAYELLGGCVDTVRWEQASGKKAKKNDESRNVDEFARINVALASKIADNILASNSYQRHFDMVLARLQDPNPYSQVLAYLIVRALLGRLSGEHQIDAAHSILKAMKLETLEEMGAFMNEVENLEIFLNDISLGTAVALRPRGRHTVHRLQAAILTMLPRIPHPSNVTLEWLANAELSSVQGNIDTRGYRFVELMRSVYTLANSSSSLRLLSGHLIHVLFVALGNDALAFLTGIWLTLQNADMEQNHVCHAALRHAAAFLEAHCVSEKWIDFQTILPAIVVALQSSDAHVREAATDCISTIHRLVQAKNALAVYAFDALYGALSNKLQYLDWNDFRKYVEILHESRHYLLHDASYIVILHEQYLAYSKSDSKKQSSYKQRVICYLLSHVNACQLPTLQIALLRSIAAVSSEVKSQMLAPSLKTLAENIASTAGVSLSSPTYQEYASLLVSSLDITAANDLNDSEKSLWSTFTELVRTCLLSTVMSSARFVLLNSIRSGLFARLNMDRRVALCRLLLDTASDYQEVMPACRKLLSEVIKDASVMIVLLTALQPAADETGHRASKRARLEQPQTKTGKDELASLSLLAEILSSISLPGSLELISCLLDTLNRVVHAQSGVAADRSYLEQLLMTAVGNAVIHVQDLPKPGLIRLDILVELIRVSDNPQTFHQALLLMASMAKLTPDAVLHNVMPVFTFMGSNVFHRDDTYSFTVVQKTIENIVPVLVASLRKDNPAPLDLYISSRDFLHIFVDASNHVPRHRRAKFFDHLLDVLGPSDFLPPVCMLLVDKVSQRVIRQNAEDAQMSLTLPLHALQSYSEEQQLSVLTEILAEVHRLVAQSSTTNTSQSSFLNSSPEEEASDIAAVTKRRVLALIVFCDHALAQIPRLSSSDAHRSSSALLTSLLRLALIEDELMSKDTTTVVRKVMHSTLRIMSALDFATGVLTMIQSNDSNIQIGALELLGQRLTDVTDNMRSALTPTLITILKTIKAILVSQPVKRLRLSAFYALSSIGRTTCTGEEASLLGALPPVMEAIEEQDMSVAALNVLAPLVSKLGPRLIPSLKDIIHACVEVSLPAARAGSSQKNVNASTSIVLASQILRDLLTLLPTFWIETELVEVINLHLESCALDSTARASTSTVMKTLAKRVPSKVLLPIMCKLWSSVCGHNEIVATRCVGFFDLLKRCVRAADRAAIQEHLRVLFSMFLDAFDFAIANEVVVDIRHGMLSAFVELVAKLNETSFRPLFRRLYDWAFTSESADTAYSRQVLFCHLYISLLEFFKGLVTPYMSFLWQPFVKVLTDYASGTVQAHNLWLVVLQATNKSLITDDGAFWRNDKLRQMAPVIVKQLPVCVKVNTEDARDTLLNCLVAIVEQVTDDTLLKSTNLDMLMYTRSEDVRLRLFALTSAEAVWRAHGGKLLGFVAETASFIVECAEDENDSVVREAHKLKNAVESIAGNIDGL